MIELTIAYLQERHRYWVERIAEARVWEKRRFRAVMFAVRPHAKSYRGMFHRKTIKTGLFGRKTLDTIVIYQQTSGLDLHEIDNVLVHEMIHQYIIQNNLRDSSSHGHLFRGFMDRINRIFTGELHITVRHRAESSEGQGDKLHTLIMLQKTDGKYFCCKVNPKRVGWFGAELDRNGASWGITGYKVYTSDNVYFDSLPACRSRLSGLPVAPADLSNFLTRYNLSPLH